MNMSDKPMPTATLAAETTLASRAIQITAAALLGIVVIVGAGFVQLSSVHNAAHDYRHSMGFPCH
jgi:cobalt transporter subunit CbtB